MMLLALALQLVLRGTVVDPSGLPVPRALVYVDGTQISAETDAAGRFELRLDAERAGTLMVFRDGFTLASISFDPLDPLTREALRVELEPAPILDSVTIVAAPAPAPPASTFQRRSLDIVRTPGAAADIMRALHTLPGVAQIDDGAGLFVRGGDTSEVLVLLDDAVVFHPYRSETPGGGLFGSVEPFLIEGASFATGGFSARYGNALSAVLDLRGLRRPSAGRTTFDPLPGGWDFNVSGHYDSARGGLLQSSTRSNAGQRALGPYVGGDMDREKRRWASRNRPDLAPSAPLRMRSTVHQSTSTPLRRKCRAAANMCRSLVYTSRNPFSSADVKCRASADRMNTVLGSRKTVWRAFSTSADVMGYQCHTPLLSSSSNSRRTADISRRVMWRSLECRVRIEANSMRASSDDARPSA